jgi:hypothetical protein
MNENNNTPQDSALRNTAIISRSCQNCGHRNGDMTVAICMLSGYYCTTERSLPSVCGRFFDGWIPRPTKIGLKRWLLSLWYGS